MTAAPWHRSLGWIAAYGITLSLLEAAVVIYLRALHYTDDFPFPLVPIDRDLAITEVLREAATMVLLLVPGMLITRRALDRFAWFCIVFGVWDLFYYVWLKILIGWPASLLDWDILFLIPVPWVGPVLAPCIISIGLITFGTIVLHARSQNEAAGLRRWDWFMLCAGAATLLCSLLMDHVLYLNTIGEGGSAWSIDPDGGATFEHAGDYVPRSFPWWLFAAGCALAAAPILGFARRTRA